MVTAPRISAECDKYLRIPMGVMSDSLVTADHQVSLEPALLQHQWSLVSPRISALWENEKVETDFQIRS